MVRDDRPAFENAVRPVLRDLEAEPVPGLSVEPVGTGEVQAWLVDSSGARTGLQLESTVRGVDAVLGLAEVVQEAAVEALWRAGLSAVWPQCPRHPGTHPLEAVVAGEARWRCPRDAVAIADIGALGDH